MAFSLRLPLALDNEARIRAAQVGVTLNALICFALDQYLRGCGPSGGLPGQVVDALDSANPKRIGVRGAPLKARSVDGVAAQLGGKLSGVTLDDCRDRGLPRSIDMPSEPRRAPKALLSAKSEPVALPAAPAKPSKAETRAFMEQKRLSRRG
jgi:hypothetical protein